MQDRCGQIPSRNVADCRLGDAVPPWTVRSGGMRAGGTIVCFVVCHALPKRELLGACLGGQITLAKEDREAEGERVPMGETGETSGATVDAPQKLRFALRKIFL